MAAQHQQLKMVRATPFDQLRKVLEHPHPRDQFMLAEATEQLQFVSRQINHLKDLRQEVTPKEWNELHHAVTQFFAVVAGANK